MAGMLLSFGTQIQITNPMLGAISPTVEEYGLGVELPERVFELPKEN